MVIKKRGDTEFEEQDGWTGRVIPFDLVQAILLKDVADALRQKENRLAEIAAALEEILEAMSEEEKEGYKDALNNDGDAFAAAGLGAVLSKQVYAGMESAEINALRGYLGLLDAREGKPGQLAYIGAHQEVAWADLTAKRDGTYGKNVISAHIKMLQASFEFPEDTIEARLIAASDLLAEEAGLKREVRAETAALQMLTKETIEGLSDDDAMSLLKLKWVSPIVAAMDQLPHEAIRELVAKVTALAEKYAVTYVEVTEKINNAKNEVVTMIDNLRGNEFDMKGLGELQSLLRGGKHGQ
jgi:type I restriction enzyme M protein